MNPTDPYPPGHCQICATGLPGRRWWQLAVMPWCTGDDRRACDARRARQNAQNAQAAR